MKAYLMYRDQDFDLQQPSPVNEQALVQDLELPTLLRAMAQGDKFLYDVASKALLLGLDDPDAIRYRQDILKDCLRNAQIIREIYRLPIEASENKKSHWLGIFTRYPSGILNSSIQMLQMFVTLLKRLRSIADEHAGEFESQGFTTFFAMLQRELNDDFFAEVQQHLQALRFRRGVLISARLDRGNEGTGYVLRKPNQTGRGLVQWIRSHRSLAYSFYISDRDEAGGRALTELRDRGVNLVANALARSADHIDNFFKMLQVELAFYIGCLNLYQRLQELEEPVSFPLPALPGERKHAFRGLYDVCLALTMKQKVVGNDVNADGKDLVIITGANQGGKSTFLRSIGLAQVMMQCGMYVPAEEFSANLCPRLFTHYKRKEDATMKSGKLDEELSRMSEIVDQLTPNSLVLFNESFSATNEREGSEIARQITKALVQKRHKVFFVTHQFEFANSFAGAPQQYNAFFLRAERRDDGERTFKLVEGRPLQTSFGQDLYHQVFQTGEASPQDADQAQETPAWVA